MTQQGTSGTFSEIDHRSRFEKRKAPGDDFSS